MNKTAALLLAALVLAMTVVSGCTADRDDARSALRNSGFTDIRLGQDDVLWNGCGQGEAGIDFVAKNPRGNDVSGTVCCGAGLSIKACTVRF